MRVRERESAFLQNGHLSMMATGPRVDSTSLPRSGSSGVSQRPRQSKCAACPQHGVYPHPPSGSDGSGRSRAVPIKVTSPPKQQPKQGPSSSNSTSTSTSSNSSLLPACSMSKLEEAPCMRADRTSRRCCLSSGRPASVTEADRATASCMPSSSSYQSSASAATMRRSTCVMTSSASSGGTCAASSLWTLACKQPARQQRAQRLQCSDQRRSARMAAAASAHRAMRACAHMSLEVARLREALAAALVVAGVRPLARMCALVPREVARH